jgi:hypothetical protein
MKKWLFISLCSSILSVTSVAIAAEYEVTEDSRALQERTVQEMNVTDSSGVMDDALSLQQPDAWKQPREAAPDVELRYGGFAGARYRSNIYRERTGSSSDIIGVVAPAFALRSDFDQHEFTVKGRVEAGFYNQHTDNNYVNADLVGTGRIDVAEEEFLLVHGRARHDNVEIGAFIEDASQPSTRATEPISYRFFDVGGMYHKPLGDSLVGRLGGAVNLYDYDNVTRVDGTSSVQDARDRTEYYGQALVGYTLSHGLLPFVSADVNHRAYHRQVGATSLYERDSSGVGVYAGVEWQQDAQRRSWATAKVGYMHQKYVEDILPTIDTVGFQAEAAHQLNDDTLLRALAFRRVAENNLVGASGALQTRAQVGAVHRLSEFWEVDTTARYTNVDFQINPAFRAKRADNIADAVVGANYYIANPLYVRADYQYTHRESDFALANYQENRAMISIGLKY